MYDLWCAQSTCNVKHSQRQKRSIVGSCIKQCCKKEIILRAAEARQSHREALHCGLESSAVERFNPFHCIMNHALDAGIFNSFLSFQLNVFYADRASPFGSWQLVAHWVQESSVNRAKSFTQHSISTLWRRLC